MSRNENYNLIYAKAMYNEYKEEGRLDDYPQIHLDDDEEIGGFGDEDVTESNCVEFCTKFTRCILRIHSELNCSILSN